MYITTGTVLMTGVWIGPVAVAIAGRSGTTAAVNTAHDNSHDIMSLCER